MAGLDIFSQIHHRNKQIFSMWSGQCWEEGLHGFSPCFVSASGGGGGLFVRSETGDDVET